LISKSTCFCASTDIIDSNDSFLLIPKD
jgi:hypothetical protein